MSETRQTRPRRRAYTCDVDFETAYRAVESRDARFDGRVFCGVLSTGVYCRPVCPVPMPNRDRVRFFPTAAAAEEEGFRACRRCRPESSPDSPDWDVRADLVGRGLRLIAEGVVDDEGVEGLARRLAVGTRQLHRTFVTELGTGPLAVARTRRARLAKQLLEQTDLPSTEVAFAAGFRSVRQYHDTVRRLYGRPPGEVRRRRRRDDPGEGGPTLRLAARAPFPADPLLAFLGVRAVPGLEELNGRTFRRSLRTRGGGAVVLSLTPAASSASVALHAAVDEPTELGPVVQAARRLFDLDADPAAIDGVLSRDPALRASVRAVPGLRLPGAADPFETAVRIVLGQQVSVAGARTFCARLVARYGDALEHPAGGITHRFPSPAALAEASLDGVGLTGARVETVRRLAEAVAVGKLDLSGGGDLDETLGVLGELPGVGPWTRDLVAMRVLRHPDAFPVGDLGVRHGAEALGLPATPSKLLARAESWRPWRGYAVMHLWRASASGPSPPG
ncbi:MAG TPA: AlkA N-terminal domain-containing protein [Actinomycetota bacterium]|nr:AlkA N-terminal domain-containing protein [Actinomycetota bacterium]